MKQLFLLAALLLLSTHFAFARSVKLDDGPSPASASQDTSVTHCETDEDCDDDHYCHKKLRICMSRKGIRLGNDD